MAQSVKWINKYKAPSFLKLWKPLLKILAKLGPLKSKGNRPLKMDFEHQLKALVFFHLEEHTSAAHLLQVLKEDDFAAEVILLAIHCQEEHGEKVNISRVRELRNKIKNESRELHATNSTQSQSFSEEIDQTAIS